MESLPRGKPLLHLQFLSLSAHSPFGPYPGIASNPVHDFPPLRSSLVAVIFVSLTSDSHLHSEALSSLCLTRKLLPTVPVGICPRTTSIGRCIRVQESSFLYVLGVPMVPEATNQPFRPLIGREFFLPLLCSRAPRKYNPLILKNARENPWCSVH